MLQNSELHMKHLLFAVLCKVQDFQAATPSFYQIH